MPQCTYRLVPAFFLFLGHPGENSRHRIHSVFRIIIGKLENLRPVRGEFSTQKGVRERYLENHIDEVEALADEELDCPSGVLAAELHPLPHIIRHESDLISSLILVVDGVVETNDDVLCGNITALQKLFSTVLLFNLSSVLDAAHLNLSVVELLPNPMRSVKANCLEKKHQRNPLVIGVVNPLIVVRVRAYKCGVLSTM